MRVLEQSSGIVKFDYSALVQHHHSIVVQDGVETMGNGQDRASCELGAYCRLDELVRVVVDRGGGFVEYENVCFSEKSSGQANELTLTNTVKESNGQTEL